LWCSRLSNPPVNFGQFGEYIFIPSFAYTEKSSALMAGKVSGSGILKRGSSMRKPCSVNRIQQIYRGKSQASAWIIMVDHIF